MEWEFDKNLKVFDIVDGIPIVRNVPLFKIPLNKKGFCKPTVSIEQKEGPKVVQRCINAGKAKTCAECVNLAKELYRRNHAKNI